ncbi:AraC family transcriptional regulator [Portibacter lacus]|uniref:AraC family transcriptional regulator n=1 Tax=Portibacter lacus TaxID=1099794 RepID=A0AA37SQ27_9BACT|nr:AraC family transcriptional regulator [Portibacter lacus]GLR16836.1 AraC family transcriptional regulator [Portibacter lacus]
MKPILEPIHLGEQNSITAFQYAKTDFETPWHYHPQHELTFIENSIGTKFIGDYVGAYKPGEVVLLRSNLPHCWKNMSDQNSLSKSIVIQWNKEIYANVPELDGVFKMINIAAKGIIFSEHEVAPMISSIRGLLRLNGSQLYIELLSLLSNLSSCSYTTLSEASFKNDMPNGYNSRIAKIFDFVSIHYQRRIYLKELAGLVNMTEQSFSRFFTKMMGRSFFTYLNEYRINIAARMLSHTDHSVSNIAYECGYESLPFFHKKFNEIHQVTPISYRKNYGG